MIDSPVMAKNLEISTNHPAGQRVSELLNAQEGEYRTLVQIAMYGTIILLCAPEITRTYSVGVINQIFILIQEILLYTPNPNGDKTPPLIQDEKLNELLSQNSSTSVFFAPRLIIKVPSKISEEIYLYLRYLGYSSNNPAHLPIFKNQLFETIQTTHVSDEEVTNCLFTLQEVIKTFHQTRGI